MALNDYFKSAFGGDPSAWVNHTYQSYLGRQPNDAEMASSAMNNGGSPFHQMMSVIQAPERHMQSYSTALLGRDVTQDPEGYAYWQGVADQYGYPAMYRELSATPEAQDHLLGDGFREAGRQGAANVNALPHVFSNYTMPGLAHGNNALNALYPFGPQSQSGGGSQAPVTNAASVNATGGPPIGQVGDMTPPTMHAPTSAPAAQTQGRNAYLGKDQEMVDRVLGYEGWEDQGTFMPWWEVDRLLFEYPNSPELMQLWNEQVSPNMSDVQKRSMESMRVRGYDRDMSGLRR